MVTAPYHSECIWNIYLLLKVHYHTAWPLPHKWRIEGNYFQDIYCLAFDKKYKSIPLWLVWEKILMYAPSFNIYYYYMLLPTARLITARISMIPAPEDYRETPAVKWNGFSFFIMESGTFQEWKHWEYYFSKYFLYGRTFILKDAYL